MFDLNGIPVIGRILNALEQSSLIKKIIVVTTKNKQDDELVRYLQKNNYEYFRGSENNVLERFILALKEDNPDLVVRITADCPLIEPKIVDKVIGLAIDTDSDYTSNILKRTFPDGYDVEVIKFSILKQINKMVTDPDEREHVTQHIIKNIEKFNVKNFEASKENTHPDWRLTLDYGEDYDLIKKIYDLFPKNHYISYNDVIEKILLNPKLIKINSKYSLYK